MLFCMSLFFNNLWRWDIAEPWMKWAVAEGGTKTTTRLINKSLGIAAGSFAGSVATPFVIGAMQTVVGFLGARTRRARLRIPFAHIMAAVIFGVIATAMSTLAIYSFTYPGADVGITTFIVTMSIIPGAFIDWIFFRHPLVLRQWAGLAAFLGAGYSMLNFPDLSALASLPPWVWLTFGIALLGAVNEGVMQWQGRHMTEPTDPFVNSFWIGMATFFCAGGALIALRPWAMIRALPFWFWAGAAAIGIIVVAMHSFKLIAYQGGGSIALKKLIMQATYLITATILGWITYAEPLTAGKFIGMTGYLVAFTLMDQGTWEFVSKQRFQRTAVVR